MNNNTSKIEDYINTRANIIKPQTKQAKISYFYSKDDHNLGDINDQLKYLAKTISLLGQLKCVAIAYVHPQDLISISTENQQYLITCNQEEDAKLRLEEAVQYVIKLLSNNSPEFTMKMKYIKLKNKIINNLNAQKKHVISEVEKALNNDKIKGDDGIKVRQVLKLFRGDETSMLSQEYITTIEELITNYNEESTYPQDSYKKTRILLQTFASLAMKTLCYSYKLVSELKDLNQELVLIISPQNYHAEINLVCYLSAYFQNDNNNHTIHIGVSKLLCVPCDVYIREFNSNNKCDLKFYTRGTSGKFYTGWKYLESEYVDGDKYLQALMHHSNFAFRDDASRNARSTQRKDSSDGSISGVEILGNTDSDGSDNMYYEEGATGWL